MSRILAGWGKCIHSLFKKSVLNAREKHFSIHNFEILLLVYATDAMHILQP